MPAEGVLLEGREDLLERPLADLPNAPRRELVPLAVFPDESGLLEKFGHTPELVERLLRGWARQTLHLVPVKRLEIVRVARAADGVLHVRELVHLVHEAEGLRQRQRLVTRHRVVVAVHRHELPERLGEVVHRLLKPGIVERRAEQVFEL